MPLPFLIGIGGLIAAATSAAAGTVATVGAVDATVGTAAAAAGTAAATTAAAIGTAAASTAVGSAAIGAASTVGTAVAAAGTAAAGTAVGSAAIGAMSTVGTAVGTAAAAASSVPVIGTAASGIAAVAGTTAGSAALGTITTTGAIGAVSGISGAVKLSEAKDIKDSAVACYDAACAALEKEQNHSNAVLETLGKTKLQVWESFDTFSHLYAQIKNPPVIKGTVEQEAFSLTLDELQEIKVLAISAKDIIRGGIGSVATGKLIGLATSGGLVSTITAASTGTAMSALSGAAASNATLAAFGGGALNVGGLGMAGGTAVLGALTVAPMLMVGGLALHSKGGKALENAREIEDEIGRSIRQINQIMPELKKVRELAEKIQDTLNNLHNCYHTILNSLSNIVSNKTNYLDFSMDEKKTLERAVLCTKLLKELTLQNILNPEKENEVLDKEINRTLAHSHEMFEQIESCTNQRPQCGAKKEHIETFSSTKEYDLRIGHPGFTLFLKQYEDFVKPLTKKDHPVNHFATVSSWNHNNMNKAYALHLTDPVPEGVKESDKVESFLIRTYRTLGLTSEAKIKLELSPKVDGVSVNGTIQGDYMIDPQTRGNSNESVNIIGLDGIQVGKGVTDHPFGIQYECFVTDSDREKASEYLKLARPYVSNRHAASGIISRLSSSSDDNLLQFLSFYPIEAEGREDETYLERMDYLSNFAVVPKDMIDRKVVNGTMKELLRDIEDYFEMLTKKREYLDYSIDGMVITITDDDYRKTIGRNGRTNEFQIALKFDPATAEAEIDHVYLDSGTKGYRTIQVQLKHPVFLDEVRYDHIPVLSKDLFDKLGLREDSVITVHRVGDVIPAISVKTAGKGKLLKAPVQCTCHEFLKVRNGKLFCDNPLCRMNQVGRMVGFFIGIGLDDYNEAFANTIIDFSTNRPNTFNYVDLSDLFKLTPNVFAAGGYTTKTYTEFQDKLRAAVAKTPDYQVLGSLGISDLGPARAKQILREYKGDWDALAKDVCHHNASRIIKALGWTVGSKVVDSMDTLIGLCSTLDEMKEHMETFSSTKEYDLRVGHTGFIPSQALRDFCEHRNMELVDGKSFDILIARSLNSISGKAQVAHTKNLPIFTEELFLKQYEDYGKPMTKEDHPINHYVTTASWSYYYVNAFELMEGVF